MRSPFGTPDRTFNAENAESNLGFQSFDPLEQKVTKETKGNPNRRPRWFKPGRTWLSIRRFVEQKVTKITKDSEQTQADLDWRMGTFVPFVTFCSKWIASNVPTPAAASERRTAR